MQHSISKRALFVTRAEVGNVVGGLESKSQPTVPKSDTRLKLENKVTALEGRLKEFENICLTQKVQIADLQGVLGESNKSIKHLENWNNRIRLALMVFGVLFISTIIFVGYTYQSYDLFPSYYAISETGLNSLLTNPLIHGLWIQFGQLSLELSTASHAFLQPQPNHFFNFVVFDIKQFGKDLLGLISST